MSDGLPSPPLPETCATECPRLVIGVTDALPFRRGAGLDEQSCQSADAIAEMKALGPNDPLETMVAGQAGIAYRNVSECFHEARKSAFASKEATALRREGLAHQRVMISSMRLLLKAQRRFIPPKQSEEAGYAAENDGRDSDRWAFSKPLPPEFSLPRQGETVDGNGNIVPPPRYHLPLEYLSPKLQGIFSNDPSLLYLRENWGNYTGWENMTKEERLKMFGYKHSEYAKKHLMNKPEGEEN